jgi:hypothetical protein
MASDIKDDSIAHILMTWAKCEHCDSVVNELGMDEVGKPCPICGVPWQGAHGYFPLTVGTLVGLIQQAYHSPAHMVRFVGPADKRTPATRLAALVFYCTLGEVLMQYFLTRLMNKQHVPRHLQDRLLQDNQSLNLRRTRLFRAVTGDTWDAALRVLREGDFGDFGQVAALHKEAVEVRNRLLHHGHRWTVPADLPRQCVDNLPALLHLFVALHNHYIANSEPSAATKGAPRVPDVR